MLPRVKSIKSFTAILNADKSLEANLENKHGGPCWESLFWCKIVLWTWNNVQQTGMNKKRNFFIQGRHFRRLFKNHRNYQYFTEPSRLLSIVKPGIDVSLLEHLQSRCIDSSMYRYTPILVRVLCFLSAFCFWPHTRNSTRSHLVRFWTNQRWNFDVFWRQKHGE